MTSAKEQVPNLAIADKETKRTPAIPRSPRWVPILPEENIASLATRSSFRSSFRVTTRRSTFKSTSRAGSIEEEFMSILSQPIQDPLADLLPTPEPVAHIPEGYQQHLVTIRPGGKFAVDPATSTVYMIRELNYFSEPRQKQDLASLGLSPASENMPPLTEPYFGTKYDVHKLEGYSSSLFSNPDLCAIALTGAILGLPNILVPSTFYYRPSEVPGSVTSFLATQGAWIELRQHEVFALESKSKEPFILTPRRGSGETLPDDDPIKWLKDAKTNDTFVVYRDGRVWGNGRGWRATPARNRAKEYRDELPPIVLDTMKFVKESEDFGDTIEARETAREYRKSLRQADRINEMTIDLARASTNCLSTPDSRLVVERKSKRIFIANALEFLTKETVYTPEDIQNAKLLANNLIEPVIA